MQLHKLCFWRNIHLLWDLVLFETSSHIVVSCWHVLCLWHMTRCCYFWNKVYTFCWLIGKYKVLGCYRVRKDSHLSGEVCNTLENFSIKLNKYVNLPFQMLFVLLHFTISVSLKVLFFFFFPFCFEAWGGLEWTWIHCVPPPINVHVLFSTYLHKVEWEHECWYVEDPKLGAR